MIVTVSIVEILSRGVKVKIPDWMAPENAVKIVEKYYDDGDIVLDNDDFVSGSGEVNVAYTETDDESDCEPDFQIDEQGNEVII